MPETTPLPGQERFLAPIDETPLQETGVLDTSSPPESQWKEAWKDLRRNWLFWVSSVMLLLVAVVVIAPGLFTNLDPTYADLSKSLDPGSSGHIAGAVDRAGEDVDWVDSLISRIADIFFAIPLLLGALVMLSVINNLFPDRGEFGAIIAVVGALGLFGWPQITRITRGQVLQVKNMEFIDAARAIGATKRSNLLRHVVPNSLAPVIVTATVSLGILIVAEATLSYLGIGLPPGVVSWGNDISAAQNQIRSGQRIGVMFWPAGALAFTALGFILLGDAVSDALNPKRRTE